MLVKAPNKFGKNELTEKYNKLFGKVDKNLETYEENS